MPLGVFAFLVFFSTCFDVYPMKPRSGWAKRWMLGKTVGISAALTPNHLASVAEYSSTAVVGIHRPVLVSSGPLTASVGKLPYRRCPCTPPPTTSWWLPHPWSEPARLLIGNVRPKSETVNRHASFATPICTVAS